VAHFRIYLRHWHEKSLFLSQVAQCLKNGFYRNIDELNLIMSPLTYSADQTIFETEALRVNLRPPVADTAPSKESRYGANKAERLAQFMSGEGKVDFRDSPLLKAIAALKTHDEMKPLTEDDLIAEVNDSINPARVETSHPESMADGLNDSEITFEALAPFVVPTSLNNLSPMLGARI